MPPAELIAFSATRLARYKVPRFVEYRADDFDRTPSMRVKKEAWIARPIPAGSGTGAARAELVNDWIARRRPVSEVIDFRVRLPLELRPAEDLPADYLEQYDKVLDLSANRHRTLADLVADMEASGIRHAVVHAEYEYGDVADALNEAVGKLVSERPGQVLRLRHDLDEPGEDPAGTRPGAAGRRAGPDRPEPAAVVLRDRDR